MKEQEICIKKLKEVLEGKTDIINDENYDTGEEIAFKLLTPNKPQTFASITKKGDVIKVIRGVFGPIWTKERTNHDVIRNIKKDGDELLVSLSDVCEDENVDHIIEDEKTEKIMDGRLTYKIDYFTKKQKC